MRMLVRFSEIFGGEPHTLEVIREVMDQELTQKVYISPQVSYIMIILFDYFHLCSKLMKLRGR